MGVLEPRLLRFRVLGYGILVSNMLVLRVLGFTARFWIAGVQGSLLLEEQVIHLCWRNCEPSQAMSASAFKTTEMSSLVVLWSKYFGHLDATFCACEIKCIINLAWPGDRVGRSDKSPGSTEREG